MVNPEKTEGTIKNDKSRENVKSGTSFTSGKILSFFSFFVVGFLVFNATFSNISAISWRPVLVVEEAGVPGEHHRPWTSNW